jgi:hypothetical protein
MTSAPPTASRRSADRLLPIVRALVPPGTACEVRLFENHQYDRHWGVAIGEAVRVVAGRTKGLVVGYLYIGDSFSTIPGPDARSVLLAIRDSLERAVAKRERILATLPSA